MADAVVEALEAYCEDRTWAAWERLYEKAERAGFAVLKPWPPMDWTPLMWWAQSRRLRLIEERLDRLDSQSQRPPETTKQLVQNGTKIVINQGER